MSANIFPKYVRLACDKCGASETFDTPLVNALHAAFNAGWRAAGTEPDDKTRHYCAGCYTPTLYDELEGRIAGLDCDADDRNTLIDSLRGRINTRDKKIAELERRTDEAQDDKHS